MQLITFHNMQPEEFFRLNGDILPKEVQVIYEELSDRLKEQELKNTRLARRIELLEEQLYFARDLILEIDSFVYLNLTKAKRMRYSHIRAESYFEE